MKKKPYEPHITLFFIKSMDTKDPTYHLMTVGRDMRSLLYIGADASYIFRLNG
jgi:hypothetical protein